MEGRKLKLNWSLSALDDIRNTFLFLEKYSSRTAARWVEEVYATANKLSDPVRVLMGHPDPDLQRHRRIAFGRYFICYHLDGDRINIGRVLPAGSRATKKEDD